MNYPRFAIQLFLCAGFISTSHSSASQELTKNEIKLYKLLMEYRKETGLPAIPVSKSLTFVAQTHAKDLAENYTPNEKCNIHSWSDKANWKPVCYTDDQSQAELMWTKPQELTSYKGYGYEIAFSGKAGSPAAVKDAFAAWRKSKEHNAVILNEDIWENKWSAIGIGIYGSYAVVWFGNEPDN
jgi:uncharacterized protein YkwD